jgi:hypothetical protein
MHFTASNSIAPMRPGTVLELLPLDPPARPHAATMAGESHPTDAVSCSLLKTCAKGSTARCSNFKGEASFT